MLRIADTKTTPRERFWPFPAVDGTELKSNSWMNLKNEVIQHYTANQKQVPSEEEITKYVCDNVTVPCFEGSTPYKNFFTDPPSYASKGQKSPNWPLMLQPLKLLAKEGDKGLGDIIERVIGPFGGDAFKSWHLRIFGKPCSCSERQNTLNEEFPL